ncbi:MAG: hypothetical protein KAH14_09020 [Clostridiales bacterium]|nr:hypothetical protein [Clostridiales bacterium]
MRKILFSIVFLMIFAAVYAGGCMDAPSEEGVNVVGYLQSQFEYQFNEDDNTNSFTFNRARMGLVGNIPYDFSYYIIYEFSPYKSGPYLLDGFITYSRFAPYASISMGQFKSPFSLELNTPCQGLHTINRSLPVGQLAIPFRDLGILLEGNYKKLAKYAFAVTNGSGKSETENNASKDYAGRLVISPKECISLGGSFSMKTLLPASDGATEDDKLNKYAAEFEVDKFNVLIQAEYIMANYESSGGIVWYPPDCSHDEEWSVVVPAGTTTSSGYWAQAMYMTPWNLQPIIKYESYDPNADADNDVEDIITFGVNYFFNDWTRLQFNYLYKAEEGNEIVNDELLMQLQVKF